MSRLILLTSILLTWHKRCHKVLSTGCRALWDTYTKATLTAITDSEKSGFLKHLDGVFDPVKLQHCLKHPWEVVSYCTWFYCKKNTAIKKNMPKPFLYLLPFSQSWLLLFEPPYLIPLSFTLLKHLQIFSTSFMNHYLDRHSIFSSSPFPHKSVPSRLSIIFIALS